MHSTNKSRCGASRTPGQRSLFFALGRKNEAMCREVARAKAIGRPPDSFSRMAFLVLPVLKAELAGQRRWCGCLRLTSDQHLELCAGVQLDRVLPPPRRLRAQAHVLATTRGAAGEDDVQRWHWEEGGHRAAFAGMTAKAKAKNKEEAVLLWRRQGRQRGEVHEQQQEEERHEGGEEGSGAAVRGRRGGVEQAGGWGGGEERISRRRL
jgi:hypothetical protein